MEDHELIDRCSKNDHKAQEFLFQKHKRMVMSICYRYAPIKEDAEDCFQDTFIKIFKSIKKNKSITSLKKWIATIAINTNINAYHKRKTKLMEGELKESISDPEFFKIIESISIKELHSVINELPDGFRQVFNLYLIDGYDHSEIGKKLNISASTSRSQLARARGLLKEKLGKIGIEKYERTI